MTARHEPDLFPRMLTVIEDALDEPTAGGADLASRPSCPAPISTVSLLACWVSRWGLSGVDCCWSGECIAWPRRAIRSPTRCLPQFGQYPFAHDVDVVAKLTDREREQLQPKSHGMGNSEIARARTVGDATAKTQVTPVLPNPRPRPSPSPDRGPALRKAPPLSVVAGSPWITIGTEQPVRSPMVDVGQTGGGQQTSGGSSLSLHEGLSEGRPSASRLGRRRRRCCGPLVVGRSDRMTEQVVRFRRTPMRWVPCGAGGDRGQKVRCRSAVGYIRLT